MRPIWFPSFRFSLKSVLVLILGIAIGFSLNLETLKLLTGSRAIPLPPYVIEPPDILQVDVLGKNLSAAQPGSNQHLVGPDGRINLGTWGTVYVAGMTIEEARVAIEQAVTPVVQSPQVAVDVFAYNSKTFYVITQGAGNGDDVVEFPITGNDTVLDALSNIGGLKSPESTQVYIARPPHSGAGTSIILPVEWNKITQGYSASTNYTLLPRDRVFIAPKARIVSIK
jgi:protein involved in polysaccharide export with SLBB domain